MKHGYKNIEDYGLIGNLDTCALVSNDGSIDWLPVPHLESPSIFCSILDSDKGGVFPFNRRVDLFRNNGISNIPMYYRRFLPHRTEN
jgi:GH15 family glucan-1,4-alpha-glucosidase